MGGGEDLYHKLYGQNPILKKSHIPMHLHGIHLRSKTKNPSQRNVARDFLG